MRPARGDEAPVIDLPRRASRGYGLATDDQSGQPVDPYLDSLPAADQNRYAEALLGSHGPRQDVKLPGDRRPGIRPRD